MSTPASAGPPGALGALTVTGGPHAGLELSLARPVVTVGRAGTCDLVLDDDSVSAQHARLEWQEGTWRITDLGSVNGTAVDGARVAAGESAPLPHGSSVRLGGVRLEFHPAAGADPAAARAAYVPPVPARTLREERRGGRLPLWLVLVVVLLLAVAGYLLLSGTVRVGGPLPVPVWELAAGGTPGP